MDVWVGRKAVRHWRRSWKDLRGRVCLPTASFIRKVLCVPAWSPSSLIGPDRIDETLLKGRLPDVGKDAAAAIGVQVVGPPIVRGIPMSMAYLRRKDAEYHRAQYWRDPKKAREVSRQKYLRKRARRAALEAQVALLSAGKTEAHPDFVAMIMRDVLAGLGKQLHA